VIELPDLEVTTIVREGAARSAPHRQRPNELARDAEPRFADLEHYSAHRGLARIDPDVGTLGDRARGCRAPLGIARTARGRRWDSPVRVATARRPEPRNERQSPDS